MTPLPRKTLRKFYQKRMRLKKERSARHIETKAAKRNKKEFEESENPDPNVLRLF